MNKREMFSHINFNSKQNRIEKKLLIHLRIISMVNFSPNITFVYIHIVQVATITKRERK